MAREYTLESPFVELTFDGRPDHWKAIFAAWLAFWAVVVVGLYYLYAVVFANVVGFETALLVGVAMLVTTVSD